MIILPRTYATVPDFVEYHIDGKIIYCDASTYDLLCKDLKTIK